MALKIIGAGYGRTGTSSLKIALEELGFGKCYHMKEAFKNRHFGRWNEKADGIDISWDELFEGYQSTLDWPTTAYYQELADYYPDARVILTVRDPESWHRSIMNTIYHATRVLPKWIPAVRRIAVAIEKTVWDGEFGGRVAERDYAIGKFNRHTEEVIRNIPAERLLVYRVADGWEPLCEFLGVPVPEGMPFPRVNDTKSVQRAVLVMKCIQAIPYLAIGALAIYLGLRVF